MIGLRPAGADDIGVLEAISPNEPGYFLRCLDEGRLVILAEADGVPCGCAMLTYKPRYSLYSKLGYPEIQDVAVLPDFRQRGIASLMIDYLENEARQQGYGGIGIGVGVSRAFGPAQRLYAKLGYLPDGYGVTYDRAAAEGARAYPPDELCLMLLKEF